MVICLRRGAVCILPSLCHCHSLSVALVGLSVVIQPKLTIGMPVSDIVMWDHCQILPRLRLYPSDFTYVSNYYTPIFPVLEEGRRYPRKLAPSVVDS